MIKELEEIVARANCNAKLIDVIDKKYTGCSEDVCFYMNKNKTCSMIDHVKDAGFDYRINGNTVILNYKGKLK